MDADLKMPYRVCKIVPPPYNVHVVLQGEMSKIYEMADVAPNEFSIAGKTTIPILCETLYCN